MIFINEQPIFTKEYDLFERQSQERRGFSFLKKMKELRIGSGVNSVNMSKNGLWVGAPKFADAPFKVTLAGVLTATSADITGPINADNITSGTLTGRVVRTSDATTRVEMDVSQNALIVYESGNERVVIGAGVITFLTPAGVGSGEIFGFGTNQLGINVSGVTDIVISATNFKPTGAGVISSGDSSDYWNDISYKTLTDQGCLGCFDGGVELINGDKVSNIESLKHIKTHSKLKTIYGIPMLDYSTFPKVSYKPAPIAKKDVYIDVEKLGKTGKKLRTKKLRFKRGEKMGTDGVEMTSMFSIMIGAIKELDNRIESLEN